METKHARGPNPAPAIALLAMILALPATAAASPGPDDREFVTVLSAPEIEFDPHRAILSSEAQLFTAIYEGLFSYDPSTLEPLPAACASWTISPDRRTYTFIIDARARWSDGTNLRAEDFRAAWFRAMDPGKNAEYASFFDIVEGAEAYRTGAAVSPGSVGIAAPAERTLQVRLTHPAPWFTRLLCHHAFSPVHPAAAGVARWPDPLTVPVNGPYILAGIDEDRIVMTRNPSYRAAGSVRIPRLVVVRSDDGAEAARMYDDGLAHWLAGPVDLRSLLSTDDVLVNPLFATNYWYFRSALPPWDDHRVRRALALLLPWEEIRSEEAYFIPADTLVFGFPDYEPRNDIGSGADGEAMELLAAAGYPHGAGLPPIVLAVPADSDAGRIAGIMERAWENRISATVTVRAFAHREYLSVVRDSRAEDFTLAQSTWIGDFADPLAFLQLWLSGSRLNDAALSDPGYDELVRSSFALEGKERMRRLAEAESLLLGRAAVLPVHHSVSLNVVDVDRIEGWYTNLLDIHPYRHLGFSERKIAPNVAAAGPGVPD